jgi:hypothetical protein
MTKYGLVPELFTKLDEQTGEHGKPDVAEFAD